MPLPLIWRAEARDSLAEIIRYIAARDPNAARRISVIIQQSVLPLAAHPLLFREGRVPDTREIVAHPNYIVVYRVTASQIEIVNVLHAHRRYPR